MPNNREREELHKAIWSIADDLRGSVDGWDFKQYILGIMFYRYISENITNYINDGERRAGDTSFDYAKLKDSDAEPERANIVQLRKWHKSLRFLYIFFIDNIFIFNRC